MKPMYKTLLRTAFLISVLFCAAAFIWYTDFYAVGRELEALQYRFLYLLLVSFAAYCFGTLGWYVCLGNEKKKITVYRLFMIRQIGETVALYNPTNILAGDLYKVQLLKLCHIDRKVALTSVAASRITAILSQISLAFLAFVWLFIRLFFYHSSLNETISTLLILVVAGLFLLILFLQWVRRVPKPVEEPIGMQSWRARFGFKFRNVIHDCARFQQTNPMAFYLSFLLFTIHWIVGSLECFLVLHFLGCDVNMMHGLAMDMGVVALKSLGAFIPAQLGAEELANKVVLMLLGVSATSIWMSLSIIRRGRQFCWMVIGFFLFAWVRYRQSRFLANETV